MCNISVKPTHIGLDISPEEFNNNCIELVKKASNKTILLIDMENSKTTTQTISTFDIISADLNRLAQFFRHI